MVVWYDANDPGRARDKVRVSEVDPSLIRGSR